MLDDKLRRIKKLMEDRERLDAELSQLLGITERPKRGRPAKQENTDGPGNTGTVESENDAG
jgi:hypothetical protein